MTSDNKQTNTIKRWLGITTPFVLTAIFLFLALLNVDIPKTMELVSASSFEWMLVFVFTFLLSHFIRAVRWKVMLSSVKQDTSLQNLFGAVMIGYGVNCVIPRLGEVYRAFFLGKWENLSRTSMLGTVIVERIFDLLSLAFSVFVSILIYDGNLLNEIEWLSSALVIVSILIFIMIVILLGLFFFREKFSRIIFRLIGNISPKTAGKLNYFYDMLIEGFSTIKNSKTLVLTLFFSFLIMALYGLNSYVGLLMLRMDEIQPVNMGMGWILMTIAAFGIVLPTPGGTGSYHIITKLTLVNLFGFTVNISMAFAFLTHIIAYILFVISTLIVLFFSNIRLKREGKEVVNFISVFKNNSTAI